MAKRFVKCNFINKCSLTVHYNWSVTWVRIRITMRGNVFNSNILTFRIKIYIANSVNVIINSPLTAQLNSSVINKLFITLKVKQLCSTLFQMLINKLYTFNSYRRKFIINNLNKLCFDCLMKYYISRYRANFRTKWL